MNGKALNNCYWISVSYATVINDYVEIGFCFNNFEGGFIGTGVIIVVSGKSYLDGIVSSIHNA